MVSIEDGTGLKYARTIMRVPNAEKWDKDELQKITVTPKSLHVPKEPEVVFKEPAPQPVDPARPKQIVARQVYIKRADIEKNGFTRGCPRCDHDSAYGFGRTSRPHSNVCRQRLMTELAKTPEGQARIAAASERLDRTAYEMTCAQAQGEVMDTPAAPAAPAVPEMVVPSADSPPACIPMSVPNDVAVPDSVDVTRMGHEVDARVGHVVDTHDIDTRVGHVE